MLWHPRVHKWFLLYAWQLIHILVKQKATYYGHFYLWGWVQGSFHSYSWVCMAQMTYGWFGCWTRDCHHHLHWQSERIGNYKKSSISCSHKAQRCTTIMSGRDSLQERSAWFMCQHKTTLQIYSQRPCLMRSLKLFAKLWACFPLWIDPSHRVGHYPLHWVPTLVHCITPRGDLLISWGSDVCEHT